MHKARNIALVGYRVTGKTTLGPLVAQALGWRFVDMDDVLTERFGCTISEFVRREGWGRFRVQEAELLRELVSWDRVVVATGGGVVESEENRRILRESFHVIWLRCRPQVIMDRLQADRRTGSWRPSLTGKGVQEEVLEVLERRNPWYAEVAHLVVDTSDEPPERLLEKMMEGNLSRF